MATLPQAGDLVAGKYRVEQVLGKGGMGVVLAARHLHLGERVAIKFPVAAMFDATGHMAARLLREGRAAMRIRSEHVARVYDVGTLETGEFFLVMEYLEGRDLEALVTESGPLSVDAAIEYVLQAVEVLAEAHALGIVHRDLKPSNLFLCQRADGSPLIKVIDFGISKHPQSDLEANLTSSHGAMGTPLYMAPEQMASSRMVDARSDIWALGATLHAILTGEPPFPAGSLVEIHQRILQGTPPLRAWRPDAPLALEVALQRCMQREPADRYASVAEFAEALAEVGPDCAKSSALRARRILSGVRKERDSSTPVGNSGNLSLAKMGISPLEAAETESTARASWMDAPVASARGKGIGAGSAPASLTVKPQNPPRLGSWLWKALAAGMAGLAIFSFALLRSYQEPIHPITALPGFANSIALPNPGQTAPAPSRATIEVRPVAQTDPNQPELNPPSSEPAASAGPNRPPKAPGKSSIPSPATSSSQTSKSGRPPLRSPVSSSSASSPRHDPLADPD